MEINKNMSNRFDIFNDISIVTDEDTDDENQDVEIKENDSEYNYISEESTSEKSNSEVSKNNRNELIKTIATPHNAVSECEEKNDEKDIVNEKERILEDIKLCIEDDRAVSKASSYSVGSASMSPNNSICDLSENDKIDERTRNDLLEKVNKSEKFLTNN